MVVNSALFDKLHQAAAAHPTSPAIISNTVTDYAKAYANVWQFAHHLADLGVRRGDIVFSALPPRLEWHLAWALMALGATACNSNGLTSLDFRYDWMVVIGTDSLAPPSKTIRIDDNFLRTASDLPTQGEAVGFAEDQPARMFLSSGTTGNPKLIPMSEPLLLEKILRSQEIGVATSKPLNLMGVSSLSGFIDMVVAVENAMPLITPNSRLDFRGWVDLAIEYEATSVIGTPGQLHHFFRVCQKQGRRPRSLTRVHSTGASFRKRLFQLIQGQTGARLTSSYACTELGRLTLIDLDPTKPEGYVGLPIEGAEIQVVSEHDEVLGVNEVGIVRGKGATAATSYFENPEATAKFFRDGWFYPGDTGFIDADGALHLTGRVSEVLNIDGEKIDPQRIEEPALGFRGVAEAAAFHYILSDEVFAGLAVVPTDEFELEALGAYLEQQLRGLTPKAIFITEDIPKNEMLKPVRRDLSNRFAGKKPDWMLKPPTGKKP